MKLRAGIVLPESTKKNVPVPRDSFVPVVQAEVGSAVSIMVYRYRLLVPLVQIMEADREIRHIEIISDNDLVRLRNTLVRHFGGVTVLHQSTAPALGVGARDPANVHGTLELNQHAVFEVYAAPVQDADDYFRALRRELQEALQEGVILIERQHVTLI